MKNNVNVSKLCARLLIASCALTASLHAEAKSCCSVKKIGGDIGKGIDKGVDKTKDETDKVAADTQAATDRAAAETKAAADKVAADAQAATNLLAQQGAAISSAEMKSMINGAKYVYADTTGSMTDGYKTAVNKFQGLLDAALDALWRASAKKSVKKYGAQLLDMKHRASSLDADGQAAMNRVKRAIGGKHLDEQARADMQLLMKKIMLGGNSVPNSVKHSSFGIQLCGSAGAGYGGGESCTMMIMQTYLENGQYKVGLAQSFGVAASPVPSDIGAAMTYGLFWGPGGISDNTGASIGLALGVVLEEGLEVGVSWGIPTTIPNPDSVIPGMSISIGAGAKGEAALSAGYTQVAGKVL
jgi:hypothetical protein